MNHTDPNRPGMHMKLIRFLLKLKAQRIVYVSCNPATCARDLDYLCHGVVCICFFTLILFLFFSDTQFSSMTYQKLYADRERYWRLLQAEEHTAGRHVPSHSSYWVCLPFGAFLTPIMVTIFATQVQNSLHLFRFVDYALKFNWGQMLLLFQSFETTCSKCFLLDLQSLPGNCGDNGVWKEQEAETHSRSL